MNDTLDGTTIADLTARIVAAYARAQPLSQTELAELIEAVSTRVARIAANGAREPEPEPEPAPRPTPVVPVRRSITETHITCLLCGRKMATLRRHLGTAHEIAHPDQYRALFRLPSDYPMVAPGYAAMRADIARQTGLGRHHHKGKPGRRRRG